MPARCQVCVSPKRAAFERRVRLPQETTAHVAGELGLSAAACYRHARNHMTGAYGRVARRDAPVAPPAATRSVASDPVRTFAAAFGYEPMDWQREFLAEPRSLVLLKGRQVGASQSCAALAIDKARSKPSSLTAIISPSLRQSTEIALRCRLGLMEIGERLAQDSASVLRLDSGSRIVSLPGTDRSVRGYPADLLIVDEAAWVPDVTFVAARATVAATRGRIVVQSTPGMPSGFFWELATTTPPGWARMVVRSDEVPTIDPEFLARERAELAPSMYAQEYLAEFQNSHTVGGLWSADEWRALIRDREGQPA